MNIDNDDFVSSSGSFIDEDCKKTLIDGDILCFAAASAADGKKYKVLDGRGGAYFKSADDANAYLQELGLSTMWRETVYLPDPVENCLHSLKLMVQCILEGCNSNKYVIFISGNDNFRMKVTDTYKANRCGMHRPHHLEACRQYLLHNHPAFIVHGAEADDAMGIFQCMSEEFSTMIASLDKDLDMIPGWHYRWGNENKESQTYLVKESESYRNFFKQCITGDRTDNIEGLSETAPKKRTFPTAPLDSMIAIRDMQEYVIGGYLKKYGCDAKAKLCLERDAKLLWILRSAADMVQDGTNLYIKVRSDNMLRS